MSAVQPSFNLGQGNGQNNGQNSGQSGNLLSRPVTIRRALIADDDVELSMLLEFALIKSGFEVVTVNTGNAALQSLQQSSFSLLLLNIKLSGVRGMEVCQQVRARSDIPILMLSAHYQENDLIDALEAGADGFVVKPFSPKALLARINALLRRVADTADSANGLPALHAGDYRLDIEDRILHTRIQNISLTRLEVVVLRLLIQNAGRPVHFKTLISEAWGSFNLGNRNMLKQVIFRLRRKLDSDPDAQRSLITTAEGYCWGLLNEHQSDGAVENSTVPLY
ncbi:MAG TPA: response regulator transcription factor [Steroidobacteraceae bacterium]|nr:response regulator transcription factor [Steroidobacteraceae bacterium]